MIILSIPWGKIRGKLCESSYPFSINYFVVCLYSGSENAAGLSRTDIKRHLRYFEAFKKAQT